MILEETENYFVKGAIPPEEIDPDWIEGALMELATSKKEGGPSEHMRQQLHEIVMRYIAEGRCIAPKTCARMVLESKDVDLSRWSRRSA